MDKDELSKKHKMYESMIDRWTFWDAAYDGDKDFIDLVIKRNTRESESNFKERKIYFWRCFGGFAFLRYFKSSSGL